MAINHISGYNEQHSANNLNLNQGSDTVLATFFIPRKARIRRYGVISEASQGLLAAMRLNLATVTPGGATATAVGAGSVLNPGGARARGVAVYKDIDERVEVDSGGLVQVRAGTAAGDTSTGRVWIEYEEDPYNGTSIVSTAVKSA